MQSASAWRLSRLTRDFGGKKTAADWLSHDMRTLLDAITVLTEQL